MGAELQVVSALRLPLSQDIKVEAVVLAVGGKRAKHTRSFPYMFMREKLWRIKTRQSRAETDLAI